MADLSKSPTTSEPHFRQQPLLPSFATNLSIPVAFYKEYLITTGSKKRVELRSRRRPSRGLKVGMVRRRIVHGWREFCDEHELKVGYFFMFRYLGDLGFDESECEIEYQQVDEEEDVYLLEIDDRMKIYENDAKISKHLVEELKGRRNCIQMDVESAESYVSTMWPAYLNSLHLGEVPISAKRRKVVEVPKHDSHVCKIECPEIDEHVDAEDDEGKEENMEEDDEEMMDFDRLRRQNNGQKGEEVPESVCGHYAWKTGSSSAEPVTYFVRTLTLSALDKSRLFARANGLATECGKIILQNSEGESWVATLKHENGVYITGGWTEFALSNRLEAGRVFPRAGDCGG